LREARENQLRMIVEQSDEVRKGEADRLAMRGRAERSNQL